MLFNNGMSSEEEVGISSPFAEPVGSADKGELEIDDKIMEKIVSLYLLLVPDFDAAERSGVRACGVS